jgi:hypothetical protein
LTVLRKGVGSLFKENSSRVLANPEYGYSMFSGECGGKRFQPLTLGRRNSVQCFIAGMAYEDVQDRDRGLNSSGAENDLYLERAHRPTSWMSNRSSWIRPQSLLRVAVSVHGDQTDVSLASHAQGLLRISIRDLEQILALLTVVVTPTMDRYYYV